MSGVGRVSGDAARAVGRALVATPALTLGGVAAAAATGPTLVSRDAKATAAGAGGSAMLGLGAGALLEGVARGAHRLVPGGRTGAYGVLAGAGGAMAGAAWVAGRGEPQAGSAALGTAGAVTAVAGVSGVLAAVLAAKVPGLTVRAAGLGVASTAAASVLFVAQRDQRRDAGRVYTLPDPKLPAVDQSVPLLDPVRADSFLHRSMPGVDPATVGWGKMNDSGKRFLWQRTSTSEIERVMGKPAAEEPRRVYVGLDEAPPELAEPGFAARHLGRDEPTREDRQVRWLVDEAYERMVTTGAFERGNILVVATTSTGYINPLVPMTFEMSTLGDAATVGIQAGHKKAAFEMRNLDRAAAIHEGLLRRIHAHVEQMPPGERPTVSVYGESFGAWTSQLALGGAGLGKLDELGIERAMYTGSPSGADWSRLMAADPALTSGEHPSVVSLRSGQHAESLTPGDARGARVTLLRHDADPVSLFDASILFERPSWLASDGGERGEGISPHQRWWPGVTAVTTAIDQQNAQYFTAGTIEAKGHDYRSEVSYVMRRAYGFDDVTDEQVARMREYGRQWELRHVESPPPAA